MDIKIDENTGVKNVKYWHIYRFIKTDITIKQGHHQNWILLYKYLCIQLCKIALDNNFEFYFPSPFNLMLTLYPFQQTNVLGKSSFQGFSFLFRVCPCIDFGSLYGNMS
jgi:hypothetical protein